MTARPWAEVLIPSRGRSLRFVVVGDPAPQGSKQGYARGGRVVMVESSKKVKPWRATVAAVATKAAAEDGWAVPQVARVDVTFWFRRPKAHYRTGRFSHLLRDDAPTWHSNKPDLDKLIRAVLDALTTAGVVRDDSNVAQIQVQKRWADPGDPAGAVIILAPIYETIEEVELP